MIYGGQTWTAATSSSTMPSTGTLQRPYARYVSNGTDTVHITYTEAHPRRTSTTASITSTIKGGTLYRSDGTAFAALTQGLTTPDEGTRIFQAGATNVAWTVDAVLDPANGRPPPVVFWVQTDLAGLPTGPGRHRHALPLRALGRDRVARPPARVRRDAALLGRGRLHRPRHRRLVTPTVVYLSTNADPSTGAALTSTARTENGIGAVPCGHGRRRRRELDVFGAHAQLDAGQPEARRSRRAATGNRKGAAVAARDLCGVHQLPAADHACSPRATDERA